MMCDHDIGNADLVELRDLRAFLAVARCGSFTAAAGELGYTQSAVSQQVAALENAVGRALLTRRPVALTPAGARLAEHAAHIVLRLDVARSELAVSGDESEALRMTVTPLSATATLAAALLDVRFGRPALQITVATADPVRAAADVAGGRADVAIVDGIVDADHPLAVSDAGLLASFPISERPLALAMPAGHPLAGRPSVDLDTLIDARFIEAPAIAESVDQLLGRPRTSRQSRFIYAGTDVAMLVSLVAADHGLVLLPADMTTSQSGVRSVAIRGTSLVHRTELLVLKNAVEVHRRTIELLRG